MSSIPPSEKLFSGSLIDAWRSDAPSPAELRRGYRRFTGKRPSRPAFLRLTSGLAFGLVLGVGLAQASVVPWRRFFGQPEGVFASAKPTLPARAVRGAAPLMPQPDLPIVEQPSTLPAPPRSSAAVVDGSTRLAWPSGSSSAPYVQQQWQRAAAALRANDFERAQSALLEVERSAAGNEGDAARLARAQLLASHGRTAEALVLLTQLQAHARSRLVRDQSADLSARLAKNRGKERSTEQAPAIKQP